MESRPLTRREERRFERQTVHRWNRAHGWRSCNRGFRGLCLRCLWRDVTGLNRRQKVREIAHIREMAKNLPPTYTWVGEDGVRVYSETKRDAVS